jgi:hypothetical protein
MIFVQAVFALLRDAQQSLSQEKLRHPGHYK